MTLGIIGWAVVHSLWQATLIGGACALVFGLLPDSRARVRYALGCAGLALMVIAPAATAITAADLLGMPARRAVTGLVDDSVGLDAVVAVRAWVVPALAGVWIAGLAGALLRLGCAWRRADTLRRHDLRDAGDAVHAALANLRVTLSVAKPVAVFRSPRAQVPMVAGIRKPVILLPAAGSVMPAGDLEAVLAHELAHVRRNDCLANLLQIAAETLLFHHPAARWLSRRIRTEREYCCDDVAVTIGGDARCYARALARLDDGRGDSSVVVAATSGTLLDRIQRVVGAPRPGLTPARGLCALLVASAVALVLCAMALVVPPEMPLNARIRAKTRQPAPAMMAPADDAAPGRTQMRKRQR